MRRILIILALGFATIGYAANLPNLGAYSPLSKFVERKMESDVVSARDPNRLRKASTNKKPWVGESLGDMEEPYYPVPTPPNPCEEPYPPIWCYEFPPFPPGPIDPCAKSNPPEWCKPIVDPCDRPYPPDWCEELPPEEFPDCKASMCPELCVKTYGYSSSPSTSVPMNSGYNPAGAIKWETELVYIVRMVATNCDSAVPTDWYIYNVSAPGVVYDRTTSGFKVVFRQKSGVYSVCIIVTFRNTCTGELCKKEYCNALTATIPCDPNATITGCPTKAVTFGSTTNLGADEDGTYTWDLSGGGSLDQNGKYIAPVANSLCENNGVISMSCDGEVIDTCTIAVSGYDGCCFYDAGAYYYLGGCVQEGTEFCPNGSGQCILGYVYDCYDEPRGTIAACSGGADCASLSATCYAAHGGVGPHDNRTPNEIDAGCCPEALK